MSNNDRGEQGFYRKRKRGYYRAHKRGALDAGVLKFMHERSMRLLISSVASMFYSDYSKQIINPYCLMDIVNKP